MIGLALSSKVRFAYRLLQKRQSGKPVKFSANTKNYNFLLSNQEPRQMSLQLVATLETFFMNKTTGILSENDFHLFQKARFLFYKYGSWQGIDLGIGPACRRFSPVRPSFLKIDDN